VGEKIRMRVNVWMIAAILRALFAATRYQETPHICINDPSASECER
jgi:hypothetical protein